MSFISSTKNLLKAIKTLPTLAQSHYGSDLQIFIKDSTGEDILAFAIDSANFKLVSDALVRSLSNTLNLRRKSLLKEIDTISIGISKPLSGVAVTALYANEMLEELTDYLYDDLDKFPVICNFLSLAVLNEDDFDKENDYDYRQYLNDEIVAKIGNEPLLIEACYNKLNLYAL